MPVYYLPTANSFANIDNELDHQTEGNTITVNARANHNRRSIEQQTRVTLHFSLSFNFYEEKEKKYEQEASKGTQTSSSLRDENERYQSSSLMISYRPAIIIPRDLYII